MREPEELAPYEIEALRYSYSKLGQRVAERLLWLEAEHDRLLRESERIRHRTRRRPDAGGPVNGA